MEHEATEIISADRSTGVIVRRTAGVRGATSRAVRRSADVALSVILLIVLAPVLLLIAAAIRLDSPGPAIFRQQRLGLGMRPFTVLKFRTMRADADGARHQAYVRALITGAADTQGEDGLYKLTGDDRITTVGRTLRRWSLDELPQLWNVLRGQMALVGPRPVIAFEVDHYPEWYRERFAVRPGLTGLWQVSGRNERTYEEMVRYDVEYARRASLALDLRILLRTVRVVLVRQGVA
jgi:lipopolysaccharide/colanic/teichoic acid biosynthesis glycosyltransferase